MDALKKKIGPLPLWGWLLALVGGVVLAVVIKRAIGPGTDEPAPAAAPTLPYDGDTAPTGSVGLPNGASVDQGAGELPITDNGQWRQRALTYLIGRGTDAALADRVLAKYLEGRQRTVDQERLISLVLAGVGLPPDPPPLAPFPRPNPPDRSGSTPTPTPERPRTKGAAIAKCEAGDRWPTMYADWFALNISVNDPRLKRDGALTPCGAGYVAWLIANKGARPPEVAPVEPQTEPRQAPRPTVPAAGGARTEPYPLPAAPAPNGTTSVVPSSAPLPAPVPVLRPTGDPLPVSVTPAPPSSSTPTSSTTSKGGKGTRR